MDAAEKLRLLKSLHLLDQVPEDKLATLSDFLKPCSFPDGALLFEEGTPGDSLYFISQGHVRVSKRVVAQGEQAQCKDLAIIGPGDCIGEMSLMEPGPRSARATAQGDAVLFQLQREDLMRWLQAHPTLALGFFAELVQVLAKRLRRSSNELALLFDLSQWLLEPMTGKVLLEKVLRHLVPHLEGAWEGAAFLYNEFNDEMDRVAAEGALEGELPVPAFGERKALWLDPRTVAVALPNGTRLYGYLILRTPMALGPEAANEVSRTLTTAAGLIASALQNIRFRTEDELRARLKTAQAHGY